MTAAAAPIRVGRPITLVVARWLAPAVLLLALATVVGLRWWATRAGLDPLVVGASFGILLGSIAVVRVRRGTAPIGALRPALRSIGGAPAAAVRRVAIGVAFGLVLAAITVAAGAVPGVATHLSGRPAAPFLPWAAITILVATTEEALLRGRLFAATRRAGGVGAAMLVTTVAFAFLHVPLYGWHVVPLDLAVGIALGGLRLATGGIAAPAAAHAVADLATWWL